MKEIIVTNGIEYAIRKRTLFGYKYRSLNVPESFWSNTRDVLKYCWGSKEQVFDLYYKLYPMKSCDTK